MVRGCAIKPSLAMSVLEPQRGVVYLQGLPSTLKHLEFSSLDIQLDKGRHVVLRQHVIKAGDLNLDLAGTVCFAEPSVPEAGKTIGINNVCVLGRSGFVRQGELANANVRKPARQILGQAGDRLEGIVRASGCDRDDVRED